MVLKWGRYGRFMACSGYPECKNTLPLEQEKHPEVLCGKCGAPMLVRRGRYGAFMACSTYPACRETRPLHTEIRCPEPECRGYLVQRRVGSKGGKRGRIFYGCSEYPRCRFSVWEKPVSRACPECQAPFLVEEKRGKGLKCPRCGSRLQNDNAPGEP